MPVFNKKQFFQPHKSIPNRLVSRESSTVEFKESFNWGSKDKYGKIVASFANNKGGFLIFGVKNDPRELVGLSNSNFENKDEAEITQYLNNAFVSEIRFKKYTENIRRKEIGVIEIYEANKKPIISTKNDGVIKESEIYYRYVARSEKIKHSELQDILEIEREKVEEKWRNLLKNIGRISNVDSITVLDEGSGQPIRITDDPSAPAVRIEEDPTIGGYILRYRDVISEMRKRSKSFKHNQKFNDLMRRFKENEKFCKIRLLYPDNPDSTKAQFYHPRILDEIKKYYK